MDKDPAELIKKLAELKRWATSDFSRIAARRTETFVKENFRRQGYQNNGLKKWVQRADGTSNGILIGKQSGALRDSIRVVVSGANITVESGRIYAKIHNEGGVIVQNVTARQRAFFWAKHYEAKGRNKTADMERFKRMALSRTLTINMPQRQFMPKPSEGVPFELGEILRGDIEKKLNSII